MDSLSRLESLVTLAFGVAALAAVLWSASQGVMRPPGRRTGEIVWAAVAALLLVVTTLAARPLVAPASAPPVESR